MNLPGLSDIAENAASIAYPHVVENLPPVAIATSDVTSGPAPLTVHFDGSQSFDPEGVALSYVWRFQDGTSSHEAAPTHVFQFPGLYDVVLGVWDDFEQTALDRILITVGPPQPEIDVSPLSFDFGDVAVGTSAPTVVTVSNLGGANLDISAIGFAAGSNAAFTVTDAPTLPASLPSETGNADVTVTFMPSGAGAAAATLQITSNDTDEPVVEVALSGTGVSEEPPPEEQIAIILEIFDAAVASGDLFGVGPNERSAAGRLGALRNMLLASSDLIADGQIAEACQQLQDALDRTDGVFPPPDFVAGDAASDLTAMINNLRDSLGCNGG